MHRSAICNRWARVLVALSLVALSATLAMAQPTPQAFEKLSANDVSILFPAPKNRSDLANLIAVADLSGPTGGTKSRLWPAEDFNRFIALATDSSQVSGSQFRIRLPDEVKRIEAWFISGIRIDPGAPGLSPAIIAQFGQQPQIRFIVQPLAVATDGSVNVHDIAGHLIFHFAAGVELPLGDNCLPRSKPDDAAFKAVVRDFADLRDRLKNGQIGDTRIETAGKPLNVHPGFSGASAKPFRDAVVAILEKHLAPPRLTAMAIMGLQEPEPWIFLAMQKNTRINPPSFGAVPGPTLEGLQFAQMLNFRGGDMVVPESATNNQKPITCKSNAIPSPPFPKAERKGVATAELFKRKGTEARVKEITDIIADPAKSHFFNTDCVSCHTDTRRAMDRFGNNFSVKGVAQEVLPKEDWNVRNFGWFTSFFRGGPAEPTVTRRTATETAEVVDFINKNMLGR
jgi:hypothetical protein